jgi:hypothetical protein
MIYPELVKLHAELGPRGGQIVKLNCNKDNKELGKSLGIKVGAGFVFWGAVNWKGGRGAAGEGLQSGR